MPQQHVIETWVEKIRERYVGYLKTSFYFKDPALRDSFEQALNKEGELCQGPYPDKPKSFQTGCKALDIANEKFSGRTDPLKPALIEYALYAHQEKAIRAALDGQNIAVATGTASGKTESFLYPILFELYRQHLEGELSEPGTRAMILYPMNALANDQRERLGEICGALKEGGSAFKPTFGQYTGQTPENRSDHWRNAAERLANRKEGELILREEMRENPPHILLTNYSMLEYLLIRPDDSPLFDKGKRWQFIALDEAHQYRGAKGMEVGMLVRRLKQRLRDGGREGDFRCIATSATLADDGDANSKGRIAKFAKELFGEPFHDEGVVLGEYEERADSEKGEPRLHHAFLRALEGVFLVHENGRDSVVLNRMSLDTGDGKKSKPLEIALCRECGQHYYVGQDSGGALDEAVRDPSQDNFGVEYYLPTKEGEASHTLCRRCGRLSEGGAAACSCAAEIAVKKCENHKDHPDRINECGVCGYRRGGIGDPVQEIVHGSDGPNAVIATALHELLPDEKKKTLAFADSRQEAAFFAWYVQDSYQKLLDRNLIWRAMSDGGVSPEGLSLEDLRRRTYKQWEKGGMFSGALSEEGKKARVWSSILKEALTDERRLSLSGVGLLKWSVKLPERLRLPKSAQESPWNLTADETRKLLSYLLDQQLRVRYAMALPSLPEIPSWGDIISPQKQKSYGLGKPGGRKDVSEWGGAASAPVKQYLPNLIDDDSMRQKQKENAAVELMKTMWEAATAHDKNEADKATHMLLPGSHNGTFRLNPAWLRVHKAEDGSLWECGTCAQLTAYNIRGVCPRYRCPGRLKPADRSRLETNHYRVLYERAESPSLLNAQEHTAQIEADEARKRQEQFKNGQIHLLSSSTTFEVGVDLGDLETVFLRNVPPETFNYTQRVGRAGRRGEPGLALTYCRRNPHDLYHYENPEERIIRGRVKTPLLKMTNEKIITRHMTADALGAFFKHGQNQERFKNMEAFVGDWKNPDAAEKLRRFCESSPRLLKSLRRIVPDTMHEKTGLNDGGWIKRIAGEESRLDQGVSEVCGEYQSMEDYRLRQFESRKSTGRADQRIRTIASESTLTFLSRKAIIPKYGFPVDVVELDIRGNAGNPNLVSLQRDLSQAIAEYAPGSEVVANKRAWKSYGIKTVPNKTVPIHYYQYTSALDFEQSDENGPALSHQYLSPIFGFVTPLFETPKEPTRRASRYYTTRPFFKGFENKEPKVSPMRGGVSVTEAQPGSLIILCEGKQKEGFYICKSCGYHSTKKERSHQTPFKSSCSGSLGRYSLGHELVTDVAQMSFPGLTGGVWDAYSLGYAVLLGAAEALGVPDMDLNMTVTGGSEGPAIVLYDNVPGGAGLVALLSQEKVFKETIANARERVNGDCGCDSSCYGCLRSYRNQFAHPHLDRLKALNILDGVLNNHSLLI